MTRRSSSHHGRHERRGGAPHRLRHRRGEQHSDRRDPQQQQRHALRLDVELALRQRPVDLLVLQRAALQTGLPDDALRARVWPLLLGVTPRVRRVAAVAMQAGPQEHRDFDTVEKDVARSLWHVTGESARVRRRQQLSHIVHAVFAVCAVDPGIVTVNYYQGFHDVCATLLLVTRDPVLSCALALQLVEQHVRPFVAATFQPVQEILRVLDQLLLQADPSVAQLIKQSGMPDSWAVSWLLTWFSHVSSEHDVVARVFDACIASHPLFPVYLSVALVIRRRESLLKLEPDIAEVFPVLSALPSRLGDVDAVVADAQALWLRFPVLRVVHDAGVVPGDMGIELPIVSPSRPVAGGAAASSRQQRVWRGLAVGLGAGLGVATAMAAFAGDLPFV